VTTDGDTLYCAGLDGVIYALDAADGTVRWTFNTGTENPIAAAPALVGETLYATGGDGTLSALDAATGAERWGFSLDGEVDYGPSIANGVIYVSTKLGTLYAIGGSGAEQLAAPYTSQSTPVPQAAAASPAPSVAPASSAGSPWQTTGGPEPFFAPAGAAVDADGNLWVVDAGNDRIQVIAPDGTFVEAWDGTSGGGERFSFAKTSGGYDGDIAFAPDGRIYVAEPGSASHRVQVFDHDRTWIETWNDFGLDDGQFIEPMSVAVDTDGTVYVLDLNQARVQKFDADGNFLLGFGGRGEDEGDLDNAAYLTVDRQGNVLVTEWTHSQIVAFAPDGTFLTQWGRFGSDLGEFRNPTDVVVDTAGNIYVADLDNGRIQLLDPQGNALAAWDAGTTPTGQDNLPYALALDVAGNLYVIGVAPDHDTGGNVQKFRVMPSLVPASMATPQA
jgi:DNA-binding beta-propeller fold protein YncE